MREINAYINPNFIIGINETHNLIISSRNLDNIGFKLNLGKATKDQLQTIIECAEHLKQYTVE